MTSPPAHPPAWAPYAGSDAIVLTIVLAAMALALAFAAIQMKRPIRVPQTGDVAGVFLLIIWVAAIASSAIAVTAYGLQIKEMGLTHGLHPLPVKVGTFVYAPIAFLVILFLTRAHGWKAALASAFFGTCAAPMIFELPFDLIVMTRTWPTIPPYPALYRALYFLPLFLVEVSTFSLLTLLPTIRITRWALLALAGMFAVFGAWATIGFAYPDTPAPLAFNIAAKILSFLTGIFLFVGRDPDEMPAHA